MGMDVYGKAPSSEIGEYFRNNIWWWHPLWSYCEDIAPDIIPLDNLGHFNDGWGLDAIDSVKLADRLTREIASGRTQRHAQRRQERLDALPLEPCTICGATGSRATPPAIGPGNMRCNGCDGSGRVANDATHFALSVENVREFEVFLRQCGGFKID
ncbi:hypothetical protein [Paraburkholderia aspalathi]|uniref:Uncharacterized protein n=1 Tax=Paraburkholderia aspalathi TaxID=1324617 RepID=A0A1I7AC86_9BURK|nr:hypothetical protein [Paraburkholderia aspalathi]SFT72504.1 hypothetical protein SAMN05192563_1003255 [Paraburkholderia aspalathi]